MNEALAARLAGLRRDPARTAVLADFDGTLAHIVPEPGAARAAPEVVDLLHRLARHYGCVAVVSGRPVSFLAERLDLAVRPAGLRAIGLYGLEEACGTAVTRPPAVEVWRPVVEAAARLADAEMPAEVTVERKGLSVTLHWRTSPAAADVAAAWAERCAAELGLEIRPARMSVELAPPLAMDKGAVVERLCAGRTAALYLGDDIGDLPALEALERLGAGGAVATLRLAVASDEAPPELLAAAEQVVDGVAGAVEVLQALAAGAGA